MRHLKIHIIVLVFVSVLGLAIASESLLHAQRVAKPLQEALAALPGVEDVVIDGRGEKGSIRVKLTSNADLLTVYPQMQDLVADYVNGDTNVLSVVDERDDVLQATYRNLRFIIEEGMLTGELTRVPSAVADAAEQVQLSHHMVAIDNDHVYVQLYRDDAYLYEIIPRQLEQRV